MVTASGVTQFKIPRYLIIIFLLLFCSISLTALLYYNQQKKTIKAEKQGELLTLVAFKAFEIREWREQRIEDTESYSIMFIFPCACSRGCIRDVSTAGHRQEILSWLPAAAIARIIRYCHLLDTAGAVRLSTATKHRVARPAPADPG